jgi:2-dehydro-3-deoxygalactonokinase
VVSSAIAAARLIGLDWGSTRLRALLIGPDGRPLETRESNAGASTLTGGPAAFGAALDALIGDWHDNAPPVLACGMVGSQHGWCEVPYAPCPADAASLGLGLRQVNWRGHPVGILPGLVCDTEAGSPDVMRGEETQVMGCLHVEPQLAERSCIVLPGTHSKWARVEGGAVRGFATQMTGELFAVLGSHSVLARLLPLEGAAEPSPTAFAEGVRTVRDHGHLGLPHQLFAVRSLGVTGRMAGSELREYLSGLLIGHELRAGLQWREAAGLARAPLRLVGEPALCQRYAQALETFGVPQWRVLDNTAGAGLWRVATLVDLA